MKLQDLIQSWAKDDRRTLQLAQYGHWWILGLLLLLFFIPWVQTSSTKGRVIALLAQERKYELHSPIEGRLQHWLVQEGDVIKQGQILIELIDNDPEIFSRLTSELKAIELQLAAAQLSTKTSAYNVSRQQELLKQGLSSRLNLEKAQLELAKMKSEEAKIEGEIERFNVRLSRQQQLTIKAPSDGVLVRIIKNATGGSQYVKSGETLALIAPNNEERAVEFWVKGNDIPLVTPGRKVRIQFEGWPAFYFSGWPNYAYGIFKGVVKVVDALDDGHGNFRIIVVPETKNSWPKDYILRQGMLAKGWVLMDEVSLGYEIWRQFNGFPLNYLTPSEYHQVGNESNESAIGLPKKKN